jgi:hypothetical protein
MGRITVSSLLIVVLAGLLAGCGPRGAWQKPGVSFADAQADSRECNRLARDQAFRERFFASPFGPGYPYGPYGYRRSHYHDSYMWRGQRESELQDFCLRARGYALQPVPQ